MSWIDEMDALYVCTIFPCLAYYTTPKVEDTHSFESVLTTNQLTWCNKPEYCKIGITSFAFQTSMPGLFTMQINGIQFLYLITK